MPWLKGKHLYFVLCKRQKESDDSIDENVDLHKEYLDDFMCLDFLYYIIIFTQQVKFSKFIIEEGWGRG